jgi:4-hydroxy 2-oxovalerate aldolase
MELLVSFLKNPDINILPILDVVGEYIIPLKEHIEWGYHVPYMITGILNQHPQPAMAWMNSKEKHDYVKFYSQVDE